MKWIDKLFGKKEIKTKAVNNMMGITINASNAIFPSWQTVEAINQYTTIDELIVTGKHIQ